MLVAIDAGVEHLQAVRGIELPGDDPLPHLFADAEDMAVVAPCPPVEPLEERLHPQERRALGKTPDARRQTPARQRPARRSVRRTFRLASGVWRLPQVPGAVSRVVEGAQGREAE